MQKGLAILIGNEDSPKIGLALSGGGVRALVFHLGVFRWLAVTGQWPNVAAISSVSGGSLAVGLTLGVAGGKWPSSAQLISDVLPRAKLKLTQIDVQREYIKRSLIRPTRLFRGRANVVGDVLHDSWSLSGSLSDLPDYPDIRINCTTYETGKNWRFSKEKMGDYLTGYVTKPNFPIAQAVAASAAFPGLIGPLRMDLDAKKLIRSEFQPPEDKEALENLRAVTLWDGGVYENLGLESLYKNRSLQRGIDYLIVSDASGQLGLESRRWARSPPFYIPATRLVNIAADQTRALRSRDFVRFIGEYPSKGRYFYIKNSVPEIFKRAEKALPVDWGELQSDADVRKCANHPTNLRALTPSEFELLSNRGFEVARATTKAFEAI